MKPLLTAATIVTLGVTLGIAAPALAAGEGFYIGGGAGLHMPDDSDVSGPGFSNNVDLENDWGAIGALGYAFGNGFRVEGEIGYRTSEVDSVDGAAASGDVDATSFMANVLYDIATGTAFTPYLGVGLGAVRVDVDNATTVGGSTWDDSDTVLGGQAIAGLSYALSDRLDLFGQYAYLLTDDVEGNLANGTSAEGEYDSHNLFVGLRFRFAAPPPPPPTPVAQPAPAPAPAPPPAPEPEPEPDFVRTYLVFFDWDSDVILPEARGVIEQAVANAEAGGISRLMLTGHADTSGPAAYNVGLSERRARNVEALMQQLGLTTQVFTVEARGETDPLVPTEDGVREPQNRRVEIVLQ